jgi:hypothetical protein
MDLLLNATLLLLIATIPEGSSERKLLKLGSNRPSPEQGILVVRACFFLNSSMGSAKNSHRVVGR